MRCFLIRVFTLAAMVTGLAAAGVGIAAADPECQQTNPATGRCLVWIEVPEGPIDDGEPGADDAPSDSGSGASCFWDGTDQGITKPPPGPVPCSSDAGYWSNGYRCYVSPLAPQPPAGDPNWQGHEPGDGAVYNCFQPQTGIVIYIWSQDPPPNAGAGPSPREVAQLAIDQMELRAIDIGIAPNASPDSIGIVGMPVWLWVEQPNDHTFGPITASASAGGITVTATARVHQIAWRMGDGNKVVCRTPGTPYKTSYGDSKSPDCGHTYMTSSSNETGDKFTVTATSDWVITWQGAGQTGTIRLDGLTRSVQIAVGEAQVLVR